MNIDDPNTMYFVTKNNSKHKNVVNNNAKY